MIIQLTVAFLPKEMEEEKDLGKAKCFIGFFIFLIYAILRSPFHFNTDPTLVSMR